MPWLIQLAAGVVAQSYVNPETGQSDRVDIQHARAFASMAICDYRMDGETLVIAPEEMKSKEDIIAAMLRDAKEEAARLVVENLDAIKRVAYQLLVRSRLTGDEVANIVNAARA